MSTLAVELNCLQGLLAKAGFTDVHVRDGHLHVAAPARSIAFVLSQPGLKAEAQFGSFAVAIEAVEFSQEGVLLKFHIR
jgi:hypothetical protein